MMFCSVVMRLVHILLALHQPSTTLSTSSTLMTMSSSSLMDSILTHPAVAALSLERHPRKKLKPRHKRLFSGVALVASDGVDINANANDNGVDADADVDVDVDVDEHILLLNELGIVACDTGVVPRKEFFETYAAALFLHKQFPHVRRVADICGGHGLLSWFLLALDPTRSVVVIDRAMPPSAEVIAKQMQHHFPHLRQSNQSNNNNYQQWTYVQADISAVEPHSSTLLASVHACGTLTDYLIDLAIASGAPLAVVPCCHTIQTEKGYRPHALSGMDASLVAALVQETKQNATTTTTTTTTTTLGDVVDGIRCLTLENAGFAVEQVMIPPVFTKRNRLIMAQKSNLKSKSCEKSNSGITNERDERTSQTNQYLQQQQPFFERDTIPPPVEVPSFVGNKKAPPSSLASSSTIRIPLANDAASIAHCRAIGGKRQASARLQDAIPRHFSPTLDVSIFLPQQELTLIPTTTTTTMEQELEDLANRCCSYWLREQVEMANSATTITTITSVPPLQNKSSFQQSFRAGGGIQCRISRVGGRSIHQPTGRQSQTYKMTYQAPEGTTNMKEAAIPKEVAKLIHAIFVERIESDLGLQVR